MDLEELLPLKMNLLYPLMAKQRQARRAVLRQCQGCAKTVSVAKQGSESSVHRVLPFMEKDWSVYSHSFAWVYEIIAGDPRNKAK